MTKKQKKPKAFSANGTFFNKGGKVKIYGWGSNFEEWFRGKTEPAAPAVTLSVHPLTEDAYDSDIVAKLGGEDAAEATLGDFWREIESQANGEAGKILVDGKANIAYIRDKNNVLRAVRAYWSSVGWSFYALEFPLPYRWRAGGRVLSPRNPVALRPSDPSALEDRVANLEAWRERMAKWLGEAGNISQP